MSNMDLFAYKQHSTAQNETLEAFNGHRITIFIHSEETSNCIVSKQQRNKKEKMCIISHWP